MNDYSNAYFTKLLNIFGLKTKWNLFWYFHQLLTQNVSWKRIPSFARLYLFQQNI